MEDGRKRGTELTGLVRTAFHAGTTFDAFIDVRFNGSLVCIEMNGMGGADLDTFSTGETALCTSGACRGTRSP